MQERAVRWNIKVSKETTSPYALWGAQDMKKGDLSKFIKDAVRWRVSRRTVQDIKSCNANTNPEKLQDILDETVREVRTLRRSKKKTR